MRLIHGFYRVQGRFREIVHALKPLLRAAKREASILRFRVRRSLGLGDGVRVVCASAAAAVSRITHPAISVPTMDSPGLAGFLGRQTESSVTGEPGGAYLFLADSDPGPLAATHLESMLMVASAADLDVVLAGGAPPAADRFGHVGPVFARPGAETAAKLLRLPGRAGAERPILGAIVPHIGDCPSGARPGREMPSASSGPSAEQATTGGAEESEGARARSGEDGGRTDIAVEPGLPAWGPWIFAFDAEVRGVVRQSVHDLQVVLADLPAVPGPHTVLFLLPYLAVGGAERLLFDLLRGLDGVRSLVVTLEPHQRALGQTVDRARELTPHVYTLGDWLPREAHGGAVRHLLRRYGVHTLMSWNGTTWFYDEAPSLKETFPGLRLVNQIYNHRGGWIEHYRPSLVSAVDCHVAVNRRIAGALEDRGVPTERVRLIYHGVVVPEVVSEEERRRRRNERRSELGLPLDAVVVGTFVRIHPQKRPLDVVRLARRFRDRGVVFLLAGSGPLDAELDREIAADPPPNLVRLPMRRDPERLFDALDVCLLTSAYEGLPVFLLEGLARGIPCVSTSVGDVPELLAEGGGLLVQRPGDLTGLETALTQLRESAEQRRIGAAGRRSVERRFAIDRYQREYAREVFGHETA